MKKREHVRAKKETEKTSKKVGFDNRFLIPILAGVLLVAALVVLQTRFSEYMRMENDGFAVKDGSVTTSLGINPQDEEIKKEVGLYSFAAMDNIFSQGEALFFGDTKKVKIDQEYPVYFNHGTSLQMVNDRAVLIDMDFEEISTYQGMMIHDGHTYNVDGTQADAAEYLFLKLVNGNYMNLSGISYAQKGMEKHIGVHSIIHFEEDYFAYYELEEDVLVYKSYLNVPGDLILNIGGTEYTYEELMKALGLARENMQLPQKEDMEEETEIPVEEPLDTTDVTVEVTEKPEEPDRTEEEEDEEEADEEDEEQNEHEITEEEDEDKENKTPSAPTAPSAPSGDKTSPGVRPDNLRPDKTPGSKGEPAKKPVQEYVKPTVQVGEFVPGVYRITTDVSVNDPASRIDANKQIQFEVYEQNERGKETLKLRSYQRKSGSIEMGGGSIRPSTTYRIVYYFTYWNEYDESVVEQLGEQTITTKSIDTLGSITLTQQPGTSFNDRIEIDNLGYADGSDLEAIYGIDRTQGITLTVEPKLGVGSGTILNLNSAQVSKFKNHAKQTVGTLSVLQAKTTYTYKFTAKDFFGNKLVFINNTGEITTSNHAPEAKLNIVKNEIDDLVLSLTMKDEDAATVPKEGSGSDLDIYLVLTTERGDLSSPAELSDPEKVLYSHKLRAGDYTWSAENGLQIQGLELPRIQGLPVDTKVFATVYCDYDLQNGKGPQRFVNVGRLGLTTAGLSSLGKVYLNTEITQVTSNSAFISFKLNTDSTNPELTKLLTGITMDVITETGEDQVTAATIGFGESDTVTLESEEIPVYKQLRNGELIGYTASGLASMTDYTISPRAQAKYAGKVYDNIKVVLNANTFKTLRKPAEVQVENLLFAAGTLVFDTRVDDPDDAITGISGDKVVINLYTKTGQFVKALRIRKNQDELQTVTIKNLDVNQSYEMRFVAAEYNEGYSNATFESNKVLKVVEVSDAFRLSGTLKLQGIQAIDGDDAHYNAETKTVLTDDQGCLTGEGAIPYYIRVEKDGTLISDTMYQVDAVNDRTDVAGQYAIYKNQTVDRGDYSYVMTLYVIISNREMVLDTLEFTSETTVQGFGTAYQMIDYIKRNPTGKFVATADVVLKSQNNNHEIEEDENSPSLAGAKITETFQGQIDFQGFTLSHHYQGNDSWIFTNVGSRGKISNMVYDVYLDVTSRIWDDGMICYRNFGTISDIVVRYKGGEILGNDTMGLITRSNAATGVIERFVVKNDPVDGSEGISVYRNLGLVTCDNNGIIRYGYVYGSERGQYINCTDVNNDLDRRVGGIAASNGSLGRIYSCYSMLNLQQSTKENSNQSWSIRYGSLCGNNDGSVKNCYGIGESIPAESKNNQVSPVIGAGGGKFINVYYWCEASTQYATKTMKKMTIENLYDTGWQKRLLTTSFDIAPVEVGYYPHVAYSSDLPEQEFISLPQRQSNDRMVDLCQAEVLDYYTREDGKDAASVKFVFSNKENLDITGLAIDGLSVSLNPDSAETEDGYTTIMGEVYDPKKFQSEYTVQKIFYLKNGKEKTSDIDFMLMVDFYRPISSVDDWYEYVVKHNRNADYENVKLTADLDFAGVAVNRIQVTNTFKAKVDGQGHAISNINLQAGYNATNGSRRCLFNGNVQAPAEIHNLYVNNFKCGGTYTKNNIKYTAADSALIYRLYGATVEDVHIQGFDNISYSCVGGIAALAESGADITNCTVTGLGDNKVNFLYQENGYGSSEIKLGGIVGYTNGCRISHCLVTDLSVKADKIRSSQGVGGVAGYALNSVVDSVYAQGEIETRANKVGGVIGQYRTSSASIICVKNVYAKVDMICKTDMVGGLIGQINLDQNPITPDNNISGIAFGNVYTSNPDSMNVSHTVGRTINCKAYFYGTVIQHINGLESADLSEVEQNVVKDLLTYEQLTAEAEKTYFKTAGFEHVYSMDGTANGYLPKMYYEDSKVLLPCQKDIKLKESDEYNISITAVSTPNSNNVFYIRLKNPDNFKITGVEIDELKWHFAAPNESGNWVETTIDNASEYQENGVTTLYMQCDPEQSQAHFLDSYVMRKIKFYTQKGSGGQITAAEAERNAAAGNFNIKTLDAYTRIPATMYMDIPTVEKWNEIQSRPEYENYRITADLDFSGREFSKDLNIGRLIGNGKKTLKNVNFKGQGVNLIACLNGGMENIILQDSSVVNEKTGDCAGFIGVSNGKIKDCEFRNVSVTQNLGATGGNYCGIIAFQNGNTISDVICEDNTIKSNADYVGGLVGQIVDSATISDIQTTNVKVKGNTYTGGVFGRVYRADLSDVLLKDVQVTCGWVICGGLAGQIGDENSATSAKIRNVTITGTPTYDAEGKITDSTTKIISTRTGQDNITDYNMGGLVGICRETSEKLTVNGIYVEGYGSRVGGVYAYNLTNATNVTVEDTKVKVMVRSKYTNRSRVGGFCADQEWNTIKNAQLTNVEIETENVSQVGGIAGRLINSNIQLSTMEEGTITTDCDGDNTERKYAFVGGLVGYLNNGSVKFSGTRNVEIDGGKMHNVGGITGQLGNSITNGSSIQYSYALGDVDTDKADTEYAAVAKDSYFVKGNTNVGGLIGVHYGGTVTGSYSNLNVKATDRVGGIDGYYYNAYTKSTTGAKTYSNVTMYNNYFAGTVEATNGFAGGAVGRTGLTDKWPSTVGSRVSASGENKTGSKDERYYTYGNLILAATVTGNTDKTGAFGPDDIKFVGRNNRIWEGMRVNGIYAGQLTSGSAWMYDYWYGIKRNGVYPAEYVMPEPQSNTLQLFRSCDLKNDPSNTTSNDWHQQNVSAQRYTAERFWRNMGWNSLYFVNGTNRNRDYYWRLTIDELQDSYEASRKDSGNYLPQCRSNNKLAYTSDWLIQQQCELNGAMVDGTNTGRLPIPQLQIVIPARPEATSLVTAVPDTTGSITMNTIGAAAPGTAGYGILYASDVDAVNAEFSKDLVDNGYFILKSGSKVVAKERITQRAYSFRYGFDSKLTLIYGTFADSTLEDSEDGLWNADNLVQQGEEIYTKEKLARRIMVYGSDYYYISGGNIVSGAGTQTGEFLTLMKGKALSSDGTIWNVGQWTETGSINETTELLEETIPLFSFVYGDSQISVYSRCSEIVGAGNSKVWKEAQLFVRDQTLYPVSGTMDTVKDALLLYTLNGTTYQTILGTDGFMADMIQSDPNLPEEVSNKAIVQMTNTFDASVPYVVLEYSNGGMIGYNYATGAILFDNRIAQNISLFDYAKNFFNGNKTSQYSGVSETYRENADLSQELRSSEELEQMLGVGATDGANSTGVNIGQSNPDNTAAADEENAAMANPEQMGEGTAGTGVDTSDRQNERGENENVGESDKASESELNADTGMDVDAETGSNHVSNTGDNDANVNANTDAEVGSHQTSDAEDMDADADVEAGADANSNAEDGSDKLDDAEADPVSDADETETETENASDESSDGNEKDADSTESKDSTESTASEEAGDDSSENTESAGDVSESSGGDHFITVYNAETGMYEIVNVEKYLTEENYLSENTRLGISNLPAATGGATGGYAASKIDKSQEQGIIIYALAMAAVVLLLASGGVVFAVRKKRR
ncbi:MAG: hypothetical protein MR355_00970 [Lachnospiraceae bacterium]|nr:hypothetical protein [Lachnospiraceae bacterium]